MSGGNQLEQLRNYAMSGKWSKVFEIYKHEKALRTVKIMGTGDTLLHMAVSSGKEHVVAKMIDLVLEENNLTQNNVVVTVGGVGGQSTDIRLILRAKNDRKNTPLHLAATIGNVNMCRKMGEKDPSLIVNRNIVGETPIFLAALYGKKEAFLWFHYLYMGSLGVSPTNFAHCTRDDNDTILHCAIAEGHIDVAIEIVHLYPNLVEGMKRNKEGVSPLHLLAAKPSTFKSNWLLKIEEKNHATTFEELKKQNQKHVLVIKFIEFIKFLYWLLRFLQLPLFEADNEENILVKYTYWFLQCFSLFLVLQIMSEAGNQETISVMFTYGLMRFLLLLLLLQFFEAVLETWLREKQKTKGRHPWSLQIMNKLLQHASDQDMSERISRPSSEQLSIYIKREEFNGHWQIQASTTTPSSGTITIDTPLVIAVKNGVIEMVEKILELFPSRIKDVNAEGKNIVLLAVEYRQMEVFRFFCKQKWLTESLFRQVDKDGNNALHLAARLGVELNWLNPGEIKWFEFVKNSMPHCLLERYNGKMETPNDIFRESQKELMRSEGKWVAKTSQACSLVSTLVVTVAFATCTNVPGSYDKGYAILRNKPLFKLFAGFSLLALFSSLISTICFLSIVASHSQSIDSWRYVPFKLYFGMSFMFASIVCLWISFCTGTFFMLDDNSQKMDNALTNFILLSTGIILLVITQLRTFFGPTLSYILNIPSPRRKSTRLIECQP